MIAIGLLGAVVVVLSVLLILSVIPVDGKIVGAMFLLVSAGVSYPFWGRRGP